MSAKSGGGRGGLEGLGDPGPGVLAPIYTWIRGQGRSHEEAQDDTQGFFAYLLGRDFLGNVQPEGGRFRNFLLVALRRWMKDERNRVINVKRRAEVEFQDWDEPQEASATHRRPRRKTPLIGHGRARWWGAP
jgi:hypothetical protein